MMSLYATLLKLLTLDPLIFCNPLSNVICFRPFNGFESKGDRSRYLR